MLKLFGSIILIYLLIALLFYMFQRKLIYFPQKADLSPAKWGVPDEVKLIQLQTNDGISLDAWYHPAKNAKTPTIIYLHGNAGHAGLRAANIYPYINSGYGVLLLSYRGYGGSDGHPSEQGLYQDGRAAINFIKQQAVAEKCIVLFGESLGSGVAIQLATEYHLGAIIIQAGFTSLTEIGSYHYPFLPIHTFMQDRYDSYNKIEQVTAPILFIHGKLDKIVPIRFGKKLYQQTNAAKQFYIYPDAGHNNLPNSVTVVSDFLVKYGVCK